MSSLTKAFFSGLVDELEKRGACVCKKKDCPGGKKCPAYDMKKKAMDDGAGSPTDRGASIKAKIQAARRDPSTKANPKDTGPPGSGLQDPCAKAMKGRGFGKGAGEAFFGGFAEGLGKEAWGGGLAKAKELNKHIQAAGGIVQAGVEAYNKAKKGEKKPMKKKAGEAFFAGFDQAMNKEAVEGTPLGRTMPKSDPIARGGRGFMAEFLKTRRAKGGPKGSKRFLELLRSRASKAATTGK